MHKARLTEAETNEGLDSMTAHLHPNDIGVWCEVVGVAFEAARRHRITLRVLCADSTGRASARHTSCYGWCQPWLGKVTVCVRYREGGEWLSARRPVADILRTLAHELAHFVTERHGDAHDRATANILTTIQDIRRGR
jgi:hypothetical protein